MASPFFEHATPQEHFDAINEADLRIQEAIIEREIAMVESAYKLNMALADYKVMTEGGSFEDLEKLYQEATEQKAADSDGLFTRIKDFLANIWNAIAELFTGKRKEDLEAYANSDEAKNTKVDSGVDLNQANEGLNLVQRMFAKVKGSISKNNSESITDEINQDGNKLIEIGGKILAGTAGTVTLAGVLNIILNHSNFIYSLKDEVNKCVDEAKSKGNTTFFAPIKAFFKYTKTFFAGGVVKLCEIASNTTGMAGKLLKGIGGAIQGIPDSMSSAFSQIKDSRNESRSKAFGSQIEKWKEALARAEANNDTKAIENAKKQIEKLEKKKAKADEGTTDREYKFNFKDLDDAKAQIAKLEKDLEELKKAKPVDVVKVDEVEDKLSDARAEMQEIEDHADKKDDKPSDSSSTTGSGESSSKSEGSSVKGEFSAFDKITSVQSAGKNTWDQVGGLPQLNNLVKAFNNAIQSPDDDKIKKVEDALKNLEAKMGETTKPDGKPHLLHLVEPSSNPYNNKNFINDNKNISVLYSDVTKKAEELVRSYKGKTLSDQSKSVFGDDITGYDKKTGKDMSIEEQITTGRIAATMQLCKDNRLTKDVVKKILKTVEKNLNNYDNEHSKINASLSTAKNEVDKRNIKTQLQQHADAKKNWESGLEQLRTYILGLEKLDGKQDDLRALISKLKKDTDTVEYNGVEYTKAELESIMQNDYETFGVEGSDQAKTNEVASATEAFKKAISSAKRVEDLSGAITKAFNLTMKGSGSKASYTKEMLAACKSGLVGIVDKASAIISNRQNALKSHIKSVKTKGSSASQDSINACKEGYARLEAEENVVKGWSNSFASVADPSRFDAYKTNLDKLLNTTIPAFKSQYDAGGGKKIFEKDDGKGGTTTMTATSDPKIDAVRTNLESLAKKINAYNKSKNKPEVNIKSLISKRGFDWVIDLPNATEYPSDVQSGITTCNNAMKTLSSSDLKKHIKVISTVGGSVIVKFESTAFGVGLDTFVISESCDDVDLSHYDVDVEDIFDDMKNL